MFMEVIAITILLWQKLSTTAMIAEAAPASWQERWGGFPTRAERGQTGEA
jgi:hypothetical protein